MARPASGGRMEAGRGGEAGEVSRATAVRLSLYLRQLESHRERGDATVSSRELARGLGLTAAQVRKDLACLGQFGARGVGYRVPLLAGHLRRALGTDRTWRVALVGAGNMGSALVRYRGFRRQGFEIVAVFDRDKDRIGQRCGRVKVMSADVIPEVVVRLGIRLAILAVPAEAAQGVAEVLEGAGIEGILSFAPVAVRVGPETAVVSVDLAVEMEQLSFRVRSRGAGRRGLSRPGGRAGTGSRIP